MAASNPTRAPPANGDLQFVPHKTPASDETVRKEVENDGLTAEFMHRLGLLPENADLSDAFKARLGLLGSEGVQEVAEVQVALDEENMETIIRFKFSRFVKENFQNGISDSFTKDFLKEPILHKEEEVDRLASVAIWVAIQRFMGDLSTPKEAQNTREKVPVMTKIYRTLEKYARNNRKGSSSSNNNDDEKHIEQFKLQKSKVSVKNLMRKHSSSSSDKHSKRESRENTTDDGGSPSNITEKIPTFELDVLHFIVGHGILRRALRDEIYCQLCKQLTKNPSKESQVRGWMLMAMVGGCFTPSSQLARYLRCFLKEAPREYWDYAAYTRRILRRTAQNGVRYHPPNWLEYKATKLRKYVMLPVTFADGRVETIEADSATTAAEVVAKLASRVGLKDQFGFSIYISIFDKVSSLGSGVDHVMDAVSECEQVVRTKGMREEDAPWRLFFRKEMFTPWHDPAMDEVSTDLIYKQVARGIRSEEYKVKKEPMLARLTAQRFYIEHGKGVVPGKIQQNLHHFLPERALKDSKSRDHWTQLIMSSYDEQFSKVNPSAQKVKEDFTKEAPHLWPLQFAGLFEGFRISGPQLPRNDVVIGISCQGVYIMDEPYKVCKKLDFHVCVEAFCSRTEKIRGQSFSIVTVTGEDYTFISPNSETVTGLVMTFLHGLRHRSKYAVGLQDYTLQEAGNKNPFSFKLGDLILIVNEQLPVGVKDPDEWLIGINERTGQRGPFPMDNVYVLPTIGRPGDDYLNFFHRMGKDKTSTLPRKRSAMVISNATIGRHGKYGLETST